MNPIEDHMLIRRIQAGDPQAFERLVEKYYDNIFQFCVRRCNGDRVLASDLTQETFLKLVEHIQQYRPTGKFINFLLTIAVNLCNSQYRRRPPELLEWNDSLPLQSSEDPQESILQQERAHVVQQALDRLPDIQREAVILRFYHGRKLREIAAITGVGLPTAKSRLKQGLDKLRRDLGREGILP